MDRVLQETPVMQELVELVVLVATKEMVEALETQETQEIMEMEELQEILEIQEIMEVEELQETQEIQETQETQEEQEIFQVVEVVVQEDNKIFQDILGFLLLGLLDLQEDLPFMEILDLVDLGLVLLVVIVDHQAAVLQEELQEM
jgi:hypothetical protein